MRESLGEAVCDRLDIFDLPDDFRLSVVVPVYNEATTVCRVVDRLIATGLPLEIILVDDGSDDHSAAQLSRIRASCRQSEDASHVEIRCIVHEQNLGKGAAIRSGVTASGGDVVVVQDADMEYDPADFRAMLRPLIEGHADVVYGTRYGGPDRLASPWWHTQVNRGLSTFASIAIGPRLTDVETCYKMARGDAFRAAVAACRERRFGIEIELTARFARQRLRFAEKPIRYQHRWYGEGKKIGWRDGVSAIWCIVWYGLLRR